MEMVEVMRDAGRPGKSVPDPQLVKDPASWDSQVPSGRGETEQSGRRVDQGRQLQPAASAAEANAAGALPGEVGGETGRKPFRLAGLQGCTPLEGISTFYCEAWPPTGSGALPAALPESSHCCSVWNPLGSC